MFQFGTDLINNANRILKKVESSGYPYKNVAGSALLNIAYQKLNFIQRGRRFLKLLLEASRNFSWTIERSGVKSHSIALVTTNRDDARKRFEAFLNNEDPDYVKYEKGSVRLRVLFSTVIQSLFFIAKRKSLCELFILQACRRRFEAALHCKELLNYKSLYVYNEFEEAAPEFIFAFREAVGLSDSKVICYVHGFPYWPRDDKSFSFSNVQYVFSQIGDYVADNYLVKERFLKVVNRFSNLTVDVNVMSASFGCESNACKVDYSLESVTLCLSNRRWDDFNKSVFRLGGEIENKLGITVYYRPHPSLSSSYLNGLNIENRGWLVNSDVDCSSLYIMYHSTLLFELELSGCKVVRLDDGALDDFGMQRDIIHSVDDLTEYFNGG